MPHKNRELHYRAVVIARERAKARVFLLLGAACACGYSDQRALQIDHLHGYRGIRKHSFRSGTGLIYAILNGNVPLKDVGLLCANCNTIKRIERGEHQGTGRNAGTLAKLYYEPRGRWPDRKKSL